MPGFISRALVIEVLAAIEDSPHPDRVSEYSAVGEVERGVAGLCRAVRSWLRKGQPLNVALALALADFEDEVCAQGAPTARVVA